MLETLLTKEQKALREELRSFVKSVPRKLLLDMDAEKVLYPREYVVEAAKRNLIGLRFSKEYGGRGLKWVDEIIALEEIGILGSSLTCLYGLVSIIGEALDVFGTDEQKRKYLAPMLKGELFCAEALTEPRGGSDFFGTTTTARARRRFLHSQRSKTVRGRSRGCGLFHRLCPYWRWSPTQIHQHLHRRA